MHPMDFFENVRLIDKSIKCIPANEVLENENATENEIVKAEESLKSAMDKLEVVSSQGENNTANGGNSNISNDKKDDNNNVASNSSSSNNSSSSTNNNKTIATNLPKTGGTDVTYIIIIGAVLVGLGAIVMFGKKKNKEAK